MQLVITALGEDRPDLIVEITRVVKDCKCQILESRLTELGSEFAAYMLVDGNWNHIVKLENAMESLAARCNLKVHTLRAHEEKAETSTVVPYTVDVFASDQIDNIHELAAFFLTRGIKIMDLSTSRYPAPFSGAPLFLAHLIVKIPTHIKIVSLRDEFLEFCDHQNLDALLEPVKR